MGCAGEWREVLRKLAGNGGKCSERKGIKDRIRLEKTEKLWGRAESARDVQDREEMKLYGRECWARVGMDC